MVEVGVVGREILNQKVAALSIRHWRHEVRAMDVGFTRTCSDMRRNSTRTEVVVHGVSEGMSMFAELCLLAPGRNLFIAR